jgi:hypothetical protein
MVKVKFFSINVWRTLTVKFTGHVQLPFFYSNLQLQLLRQ